MVGALAMSAIAWIGLLSVDSKQEQRQKLLPLVAFSAGSACSEAYPVPRPVILPAVPAEAVSAVARNSDRR